MAARSRSEDGARHVTGERFRKVLGVFPTGVVVVTAIDREGKPVGLTVNSFTSVSLEPPLVAFLPAKSSTSFPAIRDAGVFCVNVLALDQVQLCRSFAAKGTEKFAGVRWRPAPSGSPILNDVIGWIDCDIEMVTETGDHFIVIGRVLDLDIESHRSPLIFYRGAYGQLHVPSPALLNLSE